MANEKKMWFVFETSWGSMVSRKKMTLEEARLENDRARFSFKSDIIGLTYYSNLFGSYAGSSQWTYEDARAYAKAQDMKHIEDLRSRLDRHFKEED